MKKQKIQFWISTSLIGAMEGLMPLLTVNTELAREGIRHLGYPAYFGPALVFFKVLGCLILLVPAMPTRLKEWAYAGFAFDFIFAAISHQAVDGMGIQTLLPLFFLAILILSYQSYRRIYFPALPKNKSYVISSLPG